MAYIPGVPPEFQPDYVASQMEAARQREAADRAATEQTLRDSYIRDAVAGGLPEAEAIRRANSVSSFLNPFSTLSPGLPVGVQFAGGIVGTPPQAPAAALPAASAPQELSGGASMPPRSAPSVAVNNGTAPASPATVTPASVVTIGTGAAAARSLAERIKARAIEDSGSDRLSWDQWNYYYSLETGAPGISPEQAGFNRATDTWLQSMDFETWWTAMQRGGAAPGGGASSEETTTSTQTGGGEAGGGEAAGGGAGENSAGGLGKLFSLPEALLGAFGWQVPTEAALLVNLAGWGAGIYLLKRSHAL